MSVYTQKGLDTSSTTSLIELDGSWPSASSVCQGTVYTLNSLGYISYEKQSNANCIFRKIKVHVIAKTFHHARLFIAVVYWQGMPNQLLFSYVCDTTSLFIIPNIQNWTHPTLEMCRKNLVRTGLCCRVCVACRNTLPVEYHFVSSLTALLEEKSSNLTREAQPLPTAAALGGPPETDCICYLSIYSLKLNPNPNPNPFTALNWPYYILAQPGIHSLVLGKYWREYKQFPTVIVFIVSCLLSQGFLLTLHARHLSLLCWCPGPDGQCRDVGPTTLWSTVEEELHLQTQQTACSDALATQTATQYK